MHENFFEALRVAFSDAPSGRRSDSPIISGARPEDGEIQYRVVDEYDGDTLQEPAQVRTSAPMALGEFAFFFMIAWPVSFILKMNFEDDVDAALDFFSVDSDYYPDLHHLYRLRVREHFLTSDNSE